MERVQSNGEWSLFCPNEAPGLADCWGEEYDKLYTQYEKAVSLVLIKPGCFVYFRKDVSFTDYCFIIFYQIHREKQKRLFKHRVCGLQF